jgi:mannose-6-phosphate isomerase-like protein (cupin superfamily)
MSERRTVRVEDVPVMQSPDKTQRICFLIGAATSGTKNTAAGLYWLAPGCTHEPDVHPHSEEIYYVVQGRGVLRLDDEPHDVEPGMAVHIPAGVAHQTTNTGEDELCYFYVYVPPPTEPPNVSEPWTILPAGGGS